MAGSSAVRTIAAMALVMLTAAVAVAQSMGAPQAKPASAPAAKPVSATVAKPADDYDQLFSRYLQQARVTAPPRPTDAWAWMNGLSQDRRARQVNDLITVRVVEAITASGSADAQLSKASDASAGVPSLFGLEKKLPGFIDPTSLASMKTSSGFKGGGTTTRAGDFTAAMTARVIEVLPNGDLVIEGVHELEINGDQQVIVLSGVVRVTDVSPDNVVASPSIGQMRIRYFGRGLMKDNMKPGMLIRLLNKIF